MDAAPETASPKTPAKQWRRVDSWAFPQTPDETLLRAQAVVHVSALFGKKGLGSGMEIRVSTRDVQQFEGDALAVGIFSDKGPLQGPAAALDEALAGVIAELRASGEVTGAADEVTLLHTLGKIEPSRVAIIGLGPRDRCTLERIRRASAIACRRLRKVKARHVGLALASAERSINLAQAARAMTEGALLGLYEFQRYKSAKGGADAAENMASRANAVSRPSPCWGADASLPCVPPSSAARYWPRRPTSPATWATSRRTC